MIWYGYILWNGYHTIKLVNTSITSHNYLSCVYVCMWREHLPWLFLWLQVYNSVLLPVITMLYVRSPERIHLTNTSLHLLTSIFPPPWHPQPPAATLPLSVLVSLAMSEPMYNWDHAEFFCVWLIPFNRMSSSSIHVTASGRIFLSCGWVMFHCACLCFLCLCPSRGPSITSHWFFSLRWNIGVPPTCFMEMDLSKSFCI